MKSDARNLINQRRMKSNLRNPRKVVDARKIINSRVGRKANVVGRRTSNFNQRSMSNFKRTIPTKPFVKVPDKKVQIERDGNILITARSKDSATSSNSRRFSSAESSSHTKTQSPHWVPANIDTADLEHISIDDVLDMDALPSAAIRPRNVPTAKPVYKTLAEEIMDMQNTMVADQVSSPSCGGSICVSNLHASVSKQDIIELFGDIGMIKHTEMRQPGTAIIEYFDSSDAIKACDLYHNRLLDGQPMQCFIQPQTSKRSFISQRLGERVQNASNLSSASSSSSYSSRVMYNPRNVKFTVKLN